MCPSYAGSFVNYSLRTSYKQEDIKSCSSIDEKSTRSLQYEFFKANLLSAQMEHKDQKLGQDVDKPVQRDKE
ncbi:hypothetical protein DSECCO2_617450 [anaerobic digester metagenome]